MDTTYSVYLKNPQQSAVFVAKITDAEITPRMIETDTSTAIAAGRIALEDNPAYNAEDGAIVTVLEFEPARGEDEMLRPVLWNFLYGAPPVPAFQLTGEYGF